MSEIAQYEKDDCAVNIHHEENSYAFPGFEISLKPFINFVKLLTGVDITRIKTKYGEKNKSFSTVWLFLYGVFTLILNITITAFFNGLYLKQRIVLPAPIIVKNGNSVSSTAPPSTNAYINILTIICITACECAFICGTHFCFFALQSRLKGLWNSLLIIEKEFKICPITYRHIRQSVWIGLVSIPLVRHFKVINRINTISNFIQMFIVFFSIIFL